MLNIVVKLLDRTLSRRFTSPLYDEHNNILLLQRLGKVILLYEYSVHYTRACAPPPTVERNADRHCHADNLNYCGWIDVMFWRVDFKSDGNNDMLVMIYSYNEVILFTFTYKQYITHHISRRRLQLNYKL